MTIIISTTTASAQGAQGGTKKEKSNKPMLRILCVATLPGAETVMLATKDEEDKWIILSEVTLRTKFVTQWLAAAKGKLHLVKKTEDEVQSLATFNYPQNAKRIILVLIPDAAKGKYSVDVIDPSRQGFSKGKSLVANYSKMPAVAKLGSTIKNVKPGEKVIMKAGPDDNGMFRMTLGYSDKKGKPVPCYDRYVSYSKESRDFLLLFPDRRQPGFAVFNLAEFGPFE